MIFLVSEVALYLQGPTTLHPVPSTLHPSPHTLHPTPSTQHSTPYTLHPGVEGVGERSTSNGRQPSTVYPTSCNLHHTLHSIPYTLHPTLNTLHPTPYTLVSRVLANALPPTANKPDMPPEARTKPYTLRPAPFHLHPTPYTLVSRGERSTSNGRQPRHATLVVAGRRHLPALHSPVLKWAVKA